MTLLRLPGLIDVHVHLRDPGQTHKEDFFTGTQAALAGGYTTIIDMPNNIKPVFTLKVLREKIKTARKKTVCNIGFYAGSVGDNFDELIKMEPYVFGLKLYLNRTTGNFLFDKSKLLETFYAWKSNKSILLHAEEDVLEMVLEVVKKTGKKTHICHVSNQAQLELIIKAKKNKLPLTAGTSAHYLFLTESEVKKIGTKAMIKPFISKKSDQNFLWQNLKWLDLIESDHAPHTIEEKKLLNFPTGFPGLETTLPLLLTAASEKKISIKRLIEMCYENPRKIFNVKTDNDTYVEVDENEEYIIKNEDLKTKCGWSPFEGYKVKGKVKRVYIRGKKVFEHGKILADRCSGKITKPFLN